MTCKHSAGDIPDYMGSATVKEEFRIEQASKLHRVRKSCQRDLAEVGRAQDAFDVDYEFSIRLKSVFRSNEGTFLLLTSEK